MSRPAQKHASFKFAGVSDPNGYYGMGVVWSDFDDSGRLDIYVANDSTPGLLYRNLGMDNLREIRLASGTAMSEDGSEQSRALDRERGFPKVSPWPRGGVK